MAAHAEHLARIGVNMVRVHTDFYDNTEGQPITAVDTEKIAKLHRFIAAMKARAFMSPLTLSGHTKLTFQTHGISKGMAAAENPFGPLFVDEHLKNAYKTWMNTLYTTVNPNTGLAIKDDPTVAILQIHNEDSLLFWTQQI